MRPTGVFVLASFIFPLLTSAVPVQDSFTSLSINEDLKSRAVVSETEYTNASDLEERSPIIEAIPVQERSSDVTAEEEDVQPEVEKRAVRGAGYGGGRRSVEERAVRGPGYGGGRRSLDERAVRGAGYKGGRRSVEERAVRGAGYGGGKRSIEERAVRGAGHNGGRRSMDERAVQEQ
ncbi:hypothetical protein AALT_g570 [Alternaria alternata]|nr:hypothetical protein AALT_g570 [Alternaria alternata]